MVATVLFLSPVPMATAAGLLALTVGVGVARRLSLGRTASAWILAGGVGLTLAAGTPVWERPAARRVAVLVDLSPSTRGADYRDRATLDRRVAELVGDTPFDLFAFADGPLRPLPATLADLPCDRTVFAPPPSADAVVLFSDGRFPPPAVAPPIFAVIDPGLENPADAAVRRLRWDGDRVTATVAGSRPVHWTGATPNDGGATPTATEVTAAVAGDDRWPEDDRLTIHAPPPATAERWWVGRSPPPAGFRSVALPTDPADYLAAGVVVLDDVPADALSTEQQRQLAAYVRDAGGGLVIGGGPDAFAAGGYGPTPLDALSPLASDPPTPAGRWVVLVDGSGSMAGPAWRTERDAVAHVLPALPPADPVRIGSFAADVTWWAAATPAGVARAVPPVEPGGVTNLVAAVRRVADSAEAAVPTHLLLMTDADADLPDPARLAADLNGRRVTLDVLATGDGQALAALRTVAAATGGTVVEQFDPGQWVTAARALARQAVPRRFVAGPTAVRWIGASGPATVAGRNRTWLKPTADELADGPDGPLAGQWRVGTGRVIAAGFVADPATLAALADRVAAEPRDPRLTVTWDAADVLRVSVDAVDGDRYLNGMAVTLDLDGPSVPVPQTGPGAYAATVDAPRRPTIAVVRADGRVVERFAVPGRYAPEFDAVGNDRAALATLAGRTGGGVVEPAASGPIRFPGPPRRTPLAPPLATAAAACVAGGLVRWRRG